MPAAGRQPLARLLPDRIASQLVVVVVVSVIALQGGLMIWLGWFRQGTRPEHPAETTGRAAALVRLLAETPASDRPRQVELMRHAAPDVAIVYPAAASASPSSGEVRDPFLRPLRNLLGDDIAIASASAGPMDPDGRPSMLVQFPDGTRASLTMPPPPRPPLGPEPFRLAILSALISLALLGIWAALWLMRPLRQIEATVEAYDPVRDFQRLPEAGPREIRTLARAFNRMQERITRLMDDRMRTLAAVGHDLRTPITRLRLRAELMDEAPEKSRMIADLDQMDAMVQSALAHLRDGHSDEALTTFDLQSLLQTIADGYADVGKPVDMAISARLPIRGRPMDVERAVANIIDNAIKYGGSAQLSLHRDGNSAVILIADEGPGIAPELRQTVLEPFVRGDQARTMNEADGFGLGLTIARSIVEAHGGTLEFADRHPRGLLVRMTVPAA